MGKKMTILQAVRKKEDNGNNLCGPIIPTIKGGFMISKILVPTDGSTAAQKAFLQKAAPENDPIPGAVIAIQNFGGFLGFQPTISTATQSHSFNW